jgi:hypothetical protein
LDMIGDEKDHEEIESPRRGSDHWRNLLAWLHGFRADGKSLWPTKLMQRAIAVKIAMKMSRLLPERMPSLPMKILRRVDDCVDGIGSAGVSVAP